MCYAYHKTWREYHFYNTYNYFLIPQKKVDISFPKIYIILDCVTVSYQIHSNHS